MNITNSRDFSAKPAGFIDRGAEMASRIGGLAAFGICIVGLFYIVAF